MSIEVDQVCIRITSLLSNDPMTIHDIVTMLDNQPSSDCTSDTIVYEALRTMALRGDVEVIGPVKTYYMRYCNAYTAFTCGPNGRWAVRRNTDNLPFATGLSVEEAKTIALTLEQANRDRIISLNGRYMVSRE